MIVEWKNMAVVLMIKHLPKDYIMKAVPVSGSIRENSLTGYNVTFDLLSTPSMTPF